MKNFLIHARSYIFRGVLAIIPLLLCALAIQLLYQLIDKKVMAFLNKFIDMRQIPGLGILLVLVVLYFIGLIFSNVIGRQLLHFIERISERIPIIKIIYQVGKQVSESLSLGNEKQAFKKAMLIDIFNRGVWTIVFVTGTVKDATTGEELCKVFVPAVPHFTAGFFLLTKSSNLRDPGWSIEEAIKLVVSGGIISPAEVKS